MSRFISDIYFITGQDNSSLSKEKSSNADKSGIDSNDEEELEEEEEIIEISPYFKGYYSDTALKRFKENASML